MRDIEAFKGRGEGVVESLKGDGMAVSESPVLHRVLQFLSGAGGGIRGEITTCAFEETHHVHVKVFRGDIGARVQVGFDQAEGDWVLRKSNEVEYEHEFTMVQRGGKERKIIDSR